MCHSSIAIHDVLVHSCAVRDADIPELPGQTLSLDKLLGDPSISLSICAADQDFPAIT